MASQLASYVPSAVVIAISHQPTNTSHIISGFVKDTMVQFEQPSAAWSAKSNSDGSIVRTHSKEGMVNMTVHLDQTSGSNDYLSALADYDEKDLSGLAGIFTCTFADSSSRTYIYSAECFISRPTSYSFGSDTTARDFVITFTKPAQYLGGSGKMDSDLVNNLSAFGVVIDDKWKTL